MTRDRRPAATEAEISDAIDVWQAGAGLGLSFGDFVGWSKAEFAAWEADADCWPRRPLSRTALQAISAERLAA